MMAKKKARKKPQAVDEKVESKAKIGMIFECGPDGADIQVCKELARKLCAELEIADVTLDNKKKLTLNCGISASQLLAEGCERVLIIWDLYPAWREHGQKPDCVKDREDIEKSLEQAGVDRRSIDLLCIREELEAWLLSDGRALSTVLSTTAHRVHISHRRKPEQVRNPKKELTKIFKEKRGWIYSDFYHAIMIIRALPDFNYLKKVPSFARFYEKLMAMCPALN